jgi:NAD(P)-dependent dehydrogenase (short-subunit alcohol dehydrogenase family)
VGAEAGAKRLDGKVAIVTGAGSGVGQGIATAMAKAGANLVLVGRTREPLQETAGRIEAAGARCRIVQGSIAEPDTATRAVAEAVEAFGRLDTVVNCAHSFTGHFPLHETPVGNFRTHLESGFFGSIYFMQAAFPHLKETRGSVINTGSTAGMEGWATMAAYAASKEAIRAMSRSASRDWGPHGVRVNVIQPGAHAKSSDEYLRDHPEHEKAIMAQIPMGYLGDAEPDIGWVAVFLASEDARYVTGQTISATGGL